MQWSCSEGSIQYVQQFEYNRGDVKLRGVNKARLTRYGDDLDRCDTIVARRSWRAVLLVEKAAPDDAGAGAECTGLPVPACLSCATDLLRAGYGIGTVQELR